MANIKLGDLHLSKEESKDIIDKKVKKKKKNRRYKRRIKKPKI